MELLDIILRFTVGAAIAFGLLSIAVAISQVGDAIMDYTNTCERLNRR